MRHDVRLEGAAFRLRPVALDDAAFIVSLRTDPGLGRFLHATSPSVEDQQRWLERYFERPGDYYFVIERPTGALEGLVGIYDIDSAAEVAEWGRWILKPGSLAAVESAWLVYRCAFDLLKLQAVYCRTVRSNEKVVSFHDSCGILTRRTLPGHFEFKGSRADAVEHRVERSQWPDIEPRLSRLASLTAKRLGYG